MKRIATGLLVVVVVALLAGCGSGSSSPMTANSSKGGGVTFRIDLAALGQNTTAAASPSLSTSLTATTTTITAVTVTLSRDGYTDIVQDLAVANNIATGTVAGLAQGYWHIAADVYSDQTLIYTGSVDVNVIAGAQVAAEILFDPADITPDPGTTGSVTVTVGLNKYPGYSKIRQYVSTILQDTVMGKIYIYDSSTNILAVYNADTMVREQDIALQAAPQALAVEPAGGSLLLGYPTGKVYRLKTSDQSLTLLADSLVSVTALVPVTSRYVLVASVSAWGPSNTYKTIDLVNGQTISSSSYWYPLGSFTFNQATGMVYALDSGLSPADMHHIAINATTGTIDGIGDSRYHGDYAFGAPIRVINSGTRVATASGNMFISTSSFTDDITYAGNLGHPFVDLVSDDSLGNLYVLNSDNIKKLLVMRQDTFFTTLAVDLIAGPSRIFNTSDSIIVFLKPDSDSYVKIFSKSSLGLI